MNDLTSRDSRTYAIMEAAMECTVNSVVDSWSQSLRKRLHLS